MTEKISLSFVITLELGLEHIDIFLKYKIFDHPMIEINMLVFKEMSAHVKRHSRGIRKD